MTDDLTRVRGSVWNPEDNCMPPDCPADYGQYVLNIRKDGSVHWEKIKPGTVWPFFGSADEIQEGWALCVGVGKLSDGRDIPDLTDRFMVMSGGQYNLGAIGGNLNKVITSSNGAHNHVISVHGHVLTIAEMPSHNHSSSTSVWRSGGHRIEDGSGHDHHFNEGPLSIGYTGGNKSHNHRADCSSKGAHTHEVETAPPPYFSLAFIIKL